MGDHGSPVKICVYLQNGNFAKKDMEIQERFITGIVCAFVLLSEDWVKIVIFDIAT